MATSDLITRQPGKGLWVLGAILLNAIKLPIWLLYYIIPAARQHPQWSWRQAIATKVLRTAVSTFSKIQISTPMVLSPTSKEKNFLVPIMPTSTVGAYSGICDDKQIKPTKICGYWYPSPYNASEDKGKKVLLHFHGGAFVIGDCRPSEMAYAAGLLTKHIGKTLMVSYRLSSNPDGRFPAALQDAVSALYYLLDLGIDYSDIVIGGDSAGGNLAVALLRHLAVRDAPALGGALLWSPWVDLAGTLTPEVLYHSPKQWTDYVPREFAIWGANAFCPPNGPIKMASEWVSPGPNPFHTKTPVWITGSGQEILFEQIRDFVNGMEKIEGNRIGFHVEEVATHDILLVANITGFEKEAENAAKAASAWLGQA